MIGHLATGGMADVWLARARGAGGFTKLVAVKTLLPAYSANKEFVDMLVKEASIAAKLLHPGIVQIFDLGLIDHQYFIAMEYVPGLTLRHVMAHARRAEVRVPIAPILRALAEVCDALHYAHSAGLIHRDVSPENIMISELGHTKILDFGIVADRSAPVTTVGHVKGKYAYMSPEVFGSGPTHRSRDIWALGVVLYELVCGRRPFEGVSDGDLILKILQGEIVPPRRHDPAISEELEWTILRCLSRKEIDRPSSANELAAMLRILMHAEIGRGGDDNLTTLLKIGRASGHAPVFQDETSEVVEDLPHVSIAEVATSDISEIAVLEPSIAPQVLPAAVPDESLMKLNRTSEILFGQPARHIIPAQDTGNLFPAVRAKPMTPGFDLFTAYRRKK
jgi:serine/threonine protein kinase